MRGCARSCRADGQRVRAGAAEVQQDQVGLVLVDDAEAGFTVTCGRDPVARALEDARQVDA